MRRRAAGMVLLAVVGCAAHALTLETAFRATVGAHVARDERFRAGAQFHGSVGALAEIVFRPGLGVAFTAEYEAATASPVMDLVTYRGYGGTRLGLSVVWWIPVQPFAFGLRLGVVGSFLRYTFTNTYFVTPGLWMEPAASLVPPRATWLKLGLALPVMVTRRADLAHSVEVSLAISAGIRAAVGQ